MILKNGINSSFSLNHPDAKHPILQIAVTILKSRINSSFSLNHPGAKHTILQIVLVHNSLRGKEWNTVNCVPHTEAILGHLHFFSLYPCSMDGI